MLFRSTLPTVNPRAEPNTIHQRFLNIRCTVVSIALFRSGMRHFSDGSGLSSYSRTMFDEAAGMEQQRGFVSVREALDMAENHHVIAISSDL